MENDGSQEPTSQHDEKQRRRREETERRLREKLKNRIRLMLLLEVGKEGKLNRLLLLLTEAKETYQESNSDDRR